VDVDETLQIGRVGLTKDEVGHSIRSVACEDPHDPHFRKRGAGSKPFHLTFRILWDSEPLRPSRFATNWAVPIAYC
jgi:hypothetical protein